jgi:hypothetical protein
LFQRIKEDVMRHEEALARIVTIVGKLTDDENVSETEKNNIKAEMNRLQEKWNYTQNNVNLNYLRYAFTAPSAPLFIKQRFNKSIQKPSAMFTTPYYLLLLSIFYILCFSFGIVQHSAPHNGTNLGIVL